MYKIEAHLHTSEGSHGGKLTAEKIRKVEDFIKLVKSGRATLINAQADEG